MRGNLFIVATPIGNFEDITMRALRILKESSVVFAEDTRTTSKLLKHYQIESKLVSCNAKNETQRIKLIQSYLDSGADVSIVSDAGTPGISDPSVRIVSYFRDINYPVYPIPGPSALITALSAAGVPTDSFTYLGFPPQKKGRQLFFKQLSEKKGTIVIYESPYRVLKSLEKIYEYAGNRYIVLARELTKKFEEYRCDYVKNILNSDLTIKGEFVVIICDESFRK